MWRIEYNSNAAKALRRLPRNIAGLIRRKIESLAVDPYAPNNNVKPLAGRPGHRLRVGGWRGWVGMREVRVTARAGDGAEKAFTATIRIDTPQEILYYRHGGILPYMVRRLLADDGAIRAG